VEKTQVIEKTRIVWRDYASAFQAALECVNTCESQAFALEFVPRALPYFTGAGETQQDDAFVGSAWDDWCGEHRRKVNHPAGTF